MKRQPLKTRNGCDRCKARRKKCDEKQPACSSCIRLNLICTWLSRGGKTSSQTQDVEASPDAVEKPGSVLLKRVPLTSLRILSEASAAGYVPFRDQGQFHFSTKIGDTYGPLIVETAPAEFHDASVLIMATLQDECTRDAMAGFSAYVTYSMDYENIKLKHEALRLYQRGLLTIHRCLTRTKSTGIGVLLAITFLGLVEVSVLQVSVIGSDTVKSLGTGDAEAAKIHFLAAANLCRNFRPDATWPLSQLALYRMVVECWLFNISTTAVFYSKCSDVMQCIDWSVLVDTFGISPVLDARTFQVSPHFSGNHDIYRLILQATCLARYRQSAQPVQIERISHEVDKLELGLPFYRKALPDKTAKLVFTKYQLYIFALRIIIAKIRDPKVTASSQPITDLVSNSRSLLEQTDMYEARIPALAWPLIIFLLAADHLLTLEYFALTIEEMHANFDPGHRARFDEVIKHVRWRMKRGMDALDLLLEEQGILAHKALAIKLR